MMRSRVKQKNQSFMYIIKNLNHGRIYVCKYRLNEIKLAVARFETNAG